MILKHGKTTAACILSVLMLFLLLFLLPSCSKEERDWEKTLHEAGKTVHIVYDGNGGKFDKYEKIDVYVAPGDPIPAVETTARLAVPLLGGYSIEGWYFASYDENGVLQVGDERIDFEKFRAESDLVIAPKWDKALVINFLNGDGRTELTYELTPKKNYNMPTVSPKREGYTFFKEYDFSLADVPEGDRTVSFPLTYDVLSGCDADRDGVINLEPRFIENLGSTPWVIVEKRADMNGGTNYYLKADIDFTGERWAAWQYRFNKAKNGVIYGNGHKFTGLSFDVQAEKGTKSYGLFPEGRICEVKDLTFENCSFGVTFPTAPISGPSFGAGFLCGFTDSLVLDQVTFTECALTVRVDAGSPPTWGVLCGEGNVMLNGTAIDLTGEVAGVTTKCEQADA